MLLRQLSTSLACANAHAARTAAHAHIAPSLAVPRRCCPCVQPAKRTCTKGPTRAGKRCRIICMAVPLRVARVSSQIKKEVGAMLANDEVMKQAVNGDRVMTDAVTAVAGVTDVYVSNDLQVVKIYVSIYSDPKGKRQAFMRLQKLEGYVRRHLGQRLTLRLTPEVRFEYDNSLEQAEIVEKVLQDEQIRLYGAPAVSQQASEAVAAEREEEDEVEWEDEPEVVVYSSQDVFYQPGPFDDMFVDSSSRNKSRNRKPAGKPRQVSKPKSKPGNETAKAAS